MPHILLKLGLLGRKKCSIHLCCVYTLRSYCPAICFNVRGLSHRAPSPSLSSISCQVYSLIHFFLSHVLKVSFIFCSSKKLYRRQSQGKGTSSLSKNPLFRKKEKCTTVRYMPIIWIEKYGVIPIIKRFIALFSEHQNYLFFNAKPQMEKWFSGRIWCWVSDTVIFLSSMKNTLAPTSNHA